MLENPKLRLLRREELFKLRRLFRANESKIDPAKQLLTAAVAELSDKTIVGMLGFELIPHSGPLFVSEAYRGNGIGVKLYEVIEAELNKTPGTGYYTFPSNDISIAIAKKLNLEKLPWEVWKREF